MELIGNIRKMGSSWGEPVQYRLPLGDRFIVMNPLIGHRVELEYLGRIHCIKCGRETRKSFAQGYCYPCFTSAPETEECVLRPELCRAHEGIARDMEYAKVHCLIEHVVYLSFTSGLKVGVTRDTQLPTRWIDQGATEAIELARTPNRYEAGRIEVALKSIISDRTNWRRMLSAMPGPEVDLVEEKKRLTLLLPPVLQQHITGNNDVIRITYPVVHFPDKVKSLDFEKGKLVSGILTGIKGQYLLFRDGSVINIRKFGGYLIHFTSPD